MLHDRWPATAIAVWLSAQMLTIAGAGRTVLVIDAVNSQVVIEVGKAGVFGFAGHAHEVSAEDVRGDVRLDPADPSQASVSLEFRASSLRVTGKGEPPADVADVQRVMLSDRVLDVRRFPTISFRSRRVSIEARRPAATELVVDGDLTLHGTTRPMTVRVTATFDADGRLTARGSCSLLQSDFGIVPVTAAGGAVRVRDEITVRFLLSARPSSPPGSVR